MNALELEIFNNLFASICEEMGVALCRSSFSPNIKERKDFSCALFDPAGRLIAQAAHIPVHLGSMAYAAAGVVEKFHPGEGDVLIFNDPYEGGTHLPDITVLCAVEHGGRRVGYLANRAHHSDIGGIAAASMPISKHIDEEGLRLAPTSLMEGGRWNESLLEWIRGQVRTPEERDGDLRAQVAALHTGRQRLLEIVGRYGEARVQVAMEDLIAYAERTSRAAIGAVPDGTYVFEDVLDDDGIDPGPFAIKAAVHVNGDALKVDFAGTAPGVRGNVNCPMPVTVSSVYYAIRCLFEKSAIVNHGSFAPVEIDAVEGSLVRAVYPSAVAGGNVETSQRIVDVVFGALHQALPTRIPAASQGTMNNVAIGGFDFLRGRNFAYYETIGGGMGARPHADGLSAVHTHMTNTMNTPAEALEQHYPFRVVQYSIRRGSGGTGRHRGGDGIVREMEVLVGCECTLITERRLYAPYGLNGGRPGKRGRNLHIRKGRSEELGPKVHVLLEPGDRLRIMTPGGGGFGG
ncbi:MAG: hydantoinase B/oxoprolinase family protein [Armatimonadetes bacterium]|nr:hydantoinase B/oxoprolinase family protein [Armatimonadota bacterium]